MTYSNDEIIKRVKKAKKNSKNLTHITDKSALSTEDKVKMGLCRHFIQFAVSKRLKVKEISEMTKIPTTRLSEIMNYKISKFKVDQLIKHLSRLADFDPQIGAYLHFLEMVAEMPTPKIKETQKLANNLKAVSKAHYSFA